MAPGLKRCWKQFILQRTKTLYQEMCLLWFPVASGWVKAITITINNVVLTCHDLNLF